MSKNKKFHKDLINLMDKHSKKVPIDILLFVLAKELVQGSVSFAGDPHEGLNSMMEKIVIAAGEDGYRMEFSTPTLH